MSWAGTLLPPHPHTTKPTGHQGCIGEALAPWVLGPCQASLHPSISQPFCPSLGLCALCSAGAVRASSIFPILSVILLFMGGLCIAASEFYKTRHNIILSAGIFFVSAGKVGMCSGKTGRASPVLATGRAPG